MNVMGKQTGEKQKGIVSATLAIGGLVILAVASVVTSIVLQKNRQTQKSQAYSVYPLQRGVCIEIGGKCVTFTPTPKPTSTKKSSAYDSNNSYVSYNLPQSRKPCIETGKGCVPLTSISKPISTPTPTPKPASTSTSTSKPTSTSTLRPRSTPTPTPSPKLTPTPTPTPTSQSSTSTFFTISLKLQGINSLPKSGVREMPVKVGLQRVGSSEIDYKMVNFRVDERGVWTGEISYNISTDNYFIFIKGPKHIGKKICDLISMEGYPGAYKCSKPEGVKLESGKGYNLNLTGITLLAGDLPEQDGLVNSYDISLVRNLLGKTDADSLALADLNLDGVVDTQDFALIQAALSVRYDDY